VDEEIYRTMVNCSIYFKRWNVGDEKSGTPQGGVISPLLANMFMHYAFDMWLIRNYPNASFECYADDAVIHCNNEV
jgi:retron-type reverse transcriptase